MSSQRLHQCTAVSRETRCTLTPACTKVCQSIEAIVMSTWTGSWYYTMLARLDHPHHPCTANPHHPSTANFHPHSCTHLPAILPLTSYPVPTSQAPHPAPIQPCSDLANVPPTKASTPQHPNHVSLHSYFESLSFHVHSPSHPLHGRPAWHCTVAACCLCQACSTCSINISSPVLSRVLCTSEIQKHIKDQGM